MIRKLARTPLRWVARGYPQNVIENASTLLPRARPDEADPEARLPTEEHWKYSRVLAPSEIEARLETVAARFVPLKGKEFGLEKSWVDLGLDSLDAIAFVCLVEEEFNCVFEETVFDNFTNAREIANYMAKNKYCF